MKKAFVFILTMAFVLSLFAGCSSNESTDVVATNAAEEVVSTLPNGQSTSVLGGASDENVDYSNNVKTDGKTVIRVGIPSDPNTLDPLVSSNSQGRQYALNPMCQHLCTSYNGELQGEIAKSWEQTDEFTYHVEIWDCIFDAAGNHMTVDDVIYCYTKAKENGIGNTRYITQMNKIDDYNMEFVLSEVNINTFASISRRINLVTQAAYEASEDQMAMNPVMTGRYQLVEYTPDSKIVYELREDYWKEGFEEDYAVTEWANADILEFYVIKETAQMGMALQTGTIDMAYQLDYMEVTNFLNSDGTSIDGYNVFKTLTSDCILMFFNCSEGSVFNGNKELRQGILYAINNEDIVNGAYNGAAVACKCFGSSIMPDFPDDWADRNYYDYDAAKAAELIESSGADLSNVTLRIMTDNNSGRKMTAQIVQLALEAVGIKSEILSYDSVLFDTYCDDPTQWDILIGSGSSSEYLTGFLTGRFTPSKFAEGQYNESFAHDDHLGELVGKLEAVETFGEASLREADEYFTEMAYAYALVNTETYTVTSDVVAGVQLNYMANLLPAACTYVWN